MLPFVAKSQMLFIDIEPIIRFGLMLLSLKVFAKLLLLPVLVRHLNIR